MSPAGFVAGGRTVRRARTAGFTLAEVLAALALLGIVIPVALEALRVASLAGQLGQRKTVAARVAGNVLNEWRAASQGLAAPTRGTVLEGESEYRWSVRTEWWPIDSMRLVTVVVDYTVQGREYDLRVSTLAGL
ncbi:MAG: type II secretion system protein [Verrucomicrobiales bacterium]|nr:type II secretion system protein [Verrucomicrobiales bacterium]